MNMDLRQPRHPHDSGPARRESVLTCGLGRMWLTQEMKLARALGEPADRDAGRFTFLRRSRETPLVWGGVILRVRTGLLNSLREFIR